MKKLVLHLLPILMLVNMQAQNLLASDTIPNDIAVMYNKVTYSDNNACMAELNTSYLPKSKTVLLYFEVPNYDFRYKTTLSDYVIIKLQHQEFKMQNKVEHKSKGLMYKFVCEISLNDFLLLFTEKLKKITFYFTPNEKLITKELTAVLGVDPEGLKYYGELAKQTVQTTISKPDKKALNALIIRLQKL